jgi:hypothetical protein
MPRCSGFVLINDQLPDGSPAMLVRTCDSEGSFREDFWDIVQGTSQEYWPKCHVTGLLPEGVGTVERKNSHMGVERSARL